MHHWCIDFNFNRADAFNFAIVRPNNALPTGITITNNIRKSCQRRDIFICQQGMDFVFRLFYNYESNVTIFCDKNLFNFKNMALQISYIDHRSTFDYMSASDNINGPVFFVQETRTITVR